MGSAKMSINGNDYIGAFAVSTDSFTLIAQSAGIKHDKAIAEILGKRIVRLSVNGSDLIGVYAAANSHALMLPGSVYSDELAHAKKELDDVSVSVFETDLNALRNNILANDKIAVVNPEYSREEAHEISERLDVEVLMASIGGFGTVGANNILTNKGIVLNNRVSEEEADEMRNIFGSLSQSTANTGALSIGLCTMANSYGVLAGASTTGYELAGIMNGLGVD